MMKISIAIFLTLMICLVIGYCVFIHPEQQRQEFKLNCMRVCDPLKSTTTDIKCYCRDVDGIWKRNRTGEL